MTSAREEILSKVRQVLKDRDADPVQDNRTQVVPVRGQISHAEQIALFIKEAEQVNATTVRVGNLASVPEAIAAVLAANNLPSEVRTGRDELMRAIPWSDHSAITVKKGVAEPTDQASVTSAFAGVAETGSLALISGPESPTSLNYLPDNHIVVLQVGQIVGSYEEVWQWLREKMGENWPRAVNWITGPSRTADIEQELLLGAHGPRRLHVVLVDEEAE